jgi:predicted GIY-YIG superfamily endonuclease
MSAVVCVTCGQTVADTHDQDLAGALVGHECPPETVYLLHFLAPIGNPANPRAMAQHYLGWSPAPASRIAQHTAGNGAAIMRAVQARGIGFEVAATWHGGRDLERRLKRWHKARQLCPICRAGGGQP